ncbi:MAG: glycosyltransferase family 4 protein [Planctomycetes bacterium]|nr:glycosyltransferase family 4 protein [Planctomycetota bacterium]
MTSVIVLAPFLSGPLRGNAVHAERKAKLLADAGLEVHLIDAKAELPREIPAAEILLALHGWRTVEQVDCILAQRPMPLIIVTTGTDVPPGLPTKWREVAAANFARASSIVVQHPEQRRELVAAFPELELGAKCVHVPPSVSLTPRKRPTTHFGDAPHLLQISGLRAIKGVGFIPEFMQALWKRIPEARYTLIGAAIEDDYARPIMDWIEAEPRCQRLEGLSHDQSLAMLADADLLVSTSRHEGLSNALLEAMATGVPVVASNIAPNRELIRDGVNGLLYDGAGGFVAAIERLAEEAALGPSLADAAQAFVARSHSPAAEQAALLAVIDRVIDGLGA